MDMSDTDSTPVEVEERDDYIIADFSEWDGNREIISDVEEVWAEAVSPEHISGTVNIYNSDMDLSGEFQDYIAEEWSKLPDQVGLERAAIVSEGVTNLAISANLDVPDLDLETFGNAEEAVKWIES